jgi:two-component system, OmpR family, response regulator MprA
VCATSETVRLLIVDDDRAVRDALRRALTVAGYEVQTADSGAQALELFAQAPPEVLVLAAGIPDIDGLEVCRRVRLVDDRLPVVMLTAREAVGERVAGLEAGADDCVAKPFDLDELKARIHALLRRCSPQTNGEDGDDLSFAEIRLDAARRGAAVGDEFAKLTRTEFQLLELLLRNPRRVLARSLIYERVWGYDFGAASNALRVYVGYLRRKLQRAGARPLIHTVRGVGYVLREP